MEREAQNKPVDSKFCPKSPLKLLLWWGWKKKTNILWSHALLSRWVCVRLTKIKISLVYYTSSLDFASFYLILFACNSNSRSVQYLKGRESLPPLGQNKKKPSNFNRKSGLGTKFHTTFAFSSPMIESLTNLISFVLLQFIEKVNSISNFLFPSYYFSNRYERILLFYHIIFFNILLYYQSFLN